MGWTSYADSKQKLIEDLTKEGRFAGPMIIVKHSLVGNNLWILLKNKETGMHAIVVEIIGYFRHFQEWGHKSLSEDCGPRVHNCPVTFLNYPADPQGFGIEWRERVRKYHDDKNAMRKSTKKAVAGMVVTYGSNQFKLIESLGRKGWRVEHLNGGLYNRLKANQLSSALRRLSA